MLHLSREGTADSGGCCIEECCPASAPGKIPQLQQQGDSCCREASASCATHGREKHLKHGDQIKEIDPAPTSLMGHMP